jgi:hypothetical protein
MSPPLSNPSTSKSYNLSRPIFGSTSPSLSRSRPNPNPPTSTSPISPTSTASSTSAITSTRSGSPCSSSFTSPPLSLPSWSESRTLRRVPPHRGCLPPFPLAQPRYQPQQRLHSAKPPPHRPERPNSKSEFT